MLVEEGFYNAKQVPAMVRYIHQWLMANDSAEHRLNRTLLHLTKAQPNDAVMTLLRVAPSCDRAAMAMWKTIMSSPRTAKLAQRILLDVLGSWPKHSTCTSDGDKTGVFALAVSFGQWPLLAPKPPLLQLSFLLPPLHLPASGAGLKPGLGAAAGPPVPLLPLCFSGPLPATLGFAVRTLKSLLCREQYKDVVMAMERRCGWDMLLWADTQHYAMGLLAR
ncbi:uncharacterized protein [Anomalospiza imberbis]|uniref:uncharacterized protein n=1 Tax=Anomalospiza imberbis TaxID=187417 RepID=UPI00358F24F6